MPLVPGGTQLHLAQQVAQAPLHKFGLDDLLHLTEHAAPQSIPPRRERPVQVSDSETELGSTRLTRRKRSTRDAQRELDEAIDETRRR